MPWDMYDERHEDAMIKAAEADRVTGVAFCECDLPRYYFPRAGWHVRIVNSAWLAWFHGDLPDDIKSRWRAIFISDEISPEDAAAQLPRYQADAVRAALKRFAYADKFLEFHWWKRCPCESARLSLERITSDGGDAEWT